MKDNITKKTSWFVSTDQCTYSGLAVTYPESIRCSEPESDFHADIAKLGKRIILVKAYGYVSSQAESELLSFIDDYIARRFEPEQKVIYLEDYLGVTGADSEARKTYITYLKDSEDFIAVVFYGLAPILKISFNLAKKLHIYASRAHAVHTYYQAIDLAFKLIREHDQSQVMIETKTGFTTASETHTPGNAGPASRPGLFGRVFRKIKEKNPFFSDKAKKQLINNYSEELIKYIASIDWQKPGICPPERDFYDGVSSKKMFDVISFVKSEIDSMVEERTDAEAVLREGETRYRLLIKYAKAGIIEYDYKIDRIVDVNDELLKITGYSRQELLSQAPAEFLTEESKIRFLERLSKIMSGEPVPQDVVYQGVGKNGEIQWFLLNENITYQNGQPDQANIVITEITKLKKTENKLIEYQEKLKRLSIRLSMVEEDQRRSMASHLHEAIGQELFVMQLQLNEFEKSISNQDLLPSLKKMKAQLLKIIQETKNLTFDLSPPVLYDFGFKEALKVLAETIENKHHIIVETYFEGEMDALRDEIKIILYRNLKELIHNTVKHAEAEKITISLKNSDSWLYVELRDNGIGFDAVNYMEETSSHDGFGLFDIKEKLNHLNGSLVIDSAPGEGTFISMQVPLQMCN